MTKQQHNINYEEFLNTLTDTQSWQSRYQYLLQSAKQLSPNPSIHRNENRIAACEAQTWLSAQCIDGRYYFSVDSQSRIIKGLALILLALCDGQSRETIQAINIDDWLTKLGLEKHLSPSRSNGFKALHQKIVQLSH